MTNHFIFQHDYARNAFNYTRCINTHCTFSDYAYQEHDVCEQLHLKNNDVFTNFDDDVPFIISNKHHIHLPLHLRILKIDVNFENDWSNIVCEHHGSQLKHVELLNKFKGVLVLSSGPTFKMEKIVTVNKNVFLILMILPEQLQVLHLPLALDYVPVQLTYLHTLKVENLSSHTLSCFPNLQELHLDELSNDVYSTSLKALYVKIYRKRVKLPDTLEILHLIGSVKKISILHLPESLIELHVLDADICMSNVWPCNLKHLKIVTNENLFDDPWPENMESIHVFYVNCYVNSGKKIEINYLPKHLLSLTIKNVNIHLNSCTLPDNLRKLSIRKICSPCIFPNTLQYLHTKSVEHLPASLSTLKAKDVSCDNLPEQLKIINVENLKFSGVLPDSLRTLKVENRCSTIKNLPHNLKCLSLRNYNRFLPLPWPAFIEYVNLPHYEHSISSLNIQNLVYFNIPQNKDILRRYLKN